MTATRPKCQRPALNRRLLAAAIRDIDGRFQRSGLDPSDQTTKIVSWEPFWEPDRAVKPTLRRTPTDIARPF